MKQTDLLCLVSYVLTNAHTIHLTHIPYQETEYFHHPRKLLHDPVNLQPLETNTFKLILKKQNLTEQV